MNKTHMFFMMFEHFLMFHITSLNFHHLVAKTTSPDPKMSVPILGSWKYHDYKWKFDFRSVDSKVIPSV